MKKTLTRVQGNERFELEITLENGRLSICGGHWTHPTSKAARHECCFGQNTTEMVRFFPEIAPFLKWHLNDMHAECEHQETLGWTWKTHPSEPCPTCGYKLGHAWTKRDLPAEVISGVEALKD